MRFRILLEMYFWKQAGQRLRRRTVVVGGVVLQSAHSAAVVVALVAVGMVGGGLWFDTMARVCGITYFVDGCVLRGVCWFGEVTVVWWWHDTRGTCA